MPPRIKLPLPARAAGTACALLLAAHAVPAAGQVPDSARRATRPQPRLLGTPVAAPAPADTVRPAPPSAPAASGPPAPAGPRLLGRPAVGAEPSAPALLGVPVSAPAQAPAAEPRVLGRPSGTAVPLAAGTTGGNATPRPDAARCGLGDYPAFRHNPLPGELRCLYGVRGPGRFGLLSYEDVPVYQPVTPLPGTHVAGIPGLPAPRAGESYEAWEWRMLNTAFGPSVRQVYNGLELLDPVVASKIVRFERELARLGVRARRRETFRSAERQAYIFQQGRSRPGPIATTTLTSWHCRVDREGRPAGRAVDYDVPGSQMARFHEAAASVGLESYGADSNDPGHVFYVGSEWLTPPELAVMRMVPRVPHVTLATGRPADESPTREALARWRQLGREFAASPFEPLPLVEPARATLPPLRIAAAPRRQAPPPPPARKRR